MKLLLIIMAIVEAPVGIGLLVMPVITISLLAGTELDTPGGLVAARLAGAAILALAIACWQARNSERSGAASGIVAAMLFYNEAAALLLVYASVRLGLQSAVIWPAFVVHEALAVWCLFNLWVTRGREARAVSQAPSE